MTANGARSFAALYIITGFGASCDECTSNQACRCPRPVSRPRSFRVGSRTARVRSRSSRKVEIEATNTFRYIANESFELEGDSLRSGQFRRGMVDLHVLPTFGKRQIDEIRRIEVTRLIDKVQRASGPSFG